MVTGRVCIVRSFCTVGIKKGTGARFMFQYVPVHAPAIVSAGKSVGISGIRYWCRYRPSARPNKPCAWHTRRFHPPPHSFWDIFDDHLHAFCIPTVHPYPVPTSSPSPFESLNIQMCLCMPTVFSESDI